MLVKPDFTEVQDEVTPGTYKVIIKKGDLKSYESGTQYVQWELETFGESEQKNNGRKIFYKTPAEGTAAFKLQRFYRAVTGQALTGQFDTEQLVGKQCEVEVVDGVSRQTGEKTGFTDIVKVRAVTM